MSALSEKLETARLLFGDVDVAIRCARCGTDFTHMKFAELLDLLTSDAPQEALEWIGEQTAPAVLAHDCAEQDDS